MGSGDLTSLIPGLGKKRPGEVTVQAKEFDLTQVAKQLALGIPVLMAAILGALDAGGVDKPFKTPAYVIAALGVTAVGLLGLAIVSAADILGRCYVQAHLPASAQLAQNGAVVDGKEVSTEQHREDRLARERHEREDKLAKKQQEREDRLAKERQDREDRLARERQEREDRLAKKRQKTDS